MSETFTAEEMAKAIRLASALGWTNTAASEQSKTADHEGRYSIVRGDRSGVFCGIVERVQAHNRVTHVDVTDCRHIWSWKDANNTADIALYGVGDGSRLLPPVARLRVLDAIEILDCTDDAESNLRSVPEWTAGKA